MEVVLKKDKGYFAKEISLLNETERKIIKLCIEGKTFSEIKKELKISDQLLNYYLNKKLKDFIEKEIKDKRIIYKSKKAYYILIDNNPDFYLEKSSKKDLYPFIENGMLNSIIVVGSPDPHGPFSARARDLHYVGFFMSYLGKFFDKTKYSNFIRLDTDVISEKLLEENLIIIGGPVTNVITYKLNTSLKVRFLQEYNWDIYSEFSNKRYSDETVGIVAKISNPWYSNKKILLFAGKRAIGTKIAINCFIENNIDTNKDFYIIVQGKDFDGDGKPEKIYLIEENYI